MRRALRRIWWLVEPIKVRIVLGMLTAFAATLTALLMPQVLSYLVNDVIGGGAAVAAVVIAGGLVAVLGLLEAVLLFLRRVFSVNPSTHVEYTLRNRLFGHLQRLPLSFHDSWESGQLLSRAMPDLNLIRRWLGFGLIMLFSDIVTITVGVVLMWSTNPVLALIYLCGALPLIAIVVQFSLRFQRLSRLGQDQAGDLATNVEQSVHGIRVLKAFGRSEHALEQYTVHASRVRETETRRGRLIAVFDATVSTLPEIALGVVLLVGLFQVAEGQVSVGAFSAFFATAMIMSGPVMMLGQMIGQTAALAAALDRHFDVADERPSIVDPERPAEFTARGARGELEFRHAAFRYQDAREGDEVLQDVHLRVRQGETLAVVGVTGSGKSTLLQLVPRLYDTTAGQVLVDGHDVRELRLEELRAATAVAFEDATLFSGSVRENVLLGADPELDEGEAEALLELALETADAGFAHSLPEGLDTRIGEQGLSLSGGQRQRIALARAIAVRPKILLLDDPLSALDTATEERVTARLREVLEGTTTLVVAHRTSTVALADRVVLLDDGRVVAVGTHAELMADDPRYRFVMADLQAERVDVEQLAGGSQRNGADREGRGE
ncbi:ABC transporter ATP-binding protein [Gulosibacter sp. 10]|uniref:ABC transporter ATP-binding protein n=1 Tax=Gulosibacter sp. 10 TaxID=1255570 RepID=UPI00097F110D|nr:ABC transporter ATP-binding protein [Gulosibacter sp. 10]SJM51093.1 Methionine ABC transporter ATP-binding protein [Gulosibacter sp. 10]